MRAYLIAATTVLVNAATYDVGLYFEPNRGQAPREVRWIARTPDSGVLIDDRGFTLRRRGASSLRLNLAGTETPVWRSGKRRPGVTNYYLPTVNASAVPHFDSVIAGGIYSGIDLRFHGADRQLEYDFIVQPGADPRRIALEFPEGKVALKPDGTLVADGTRIEAPVAYQDSERVPVRFRLAGARVGFDVDEYDRTKPLIIDPVVVSVAYSSLIGGSGEDTVADMTVNSIGEMHIAGDTDVPDFTTAKQTRLRDIFVAKLNATGTAYVWLTFFGGADTDTAAKIALDPGGNAIVGGDTRSTGLATSGASQTEKNGTSDAFIAKFNSNGQLSWATYLGGSQTETLAGLAVDNADSSIVTGGTTGSGDFPTTAGAWRTGPVPLPYQHGFVTRVSSSGARIWSTYLRRESNAIGTPLGNNVSLTALALDSSGNVVIAGDQNDGFAASEGYPWYFFNYLLKLSADGKTLLWVRGQPPATAYGRGVILAETTGLSLDAANKIYLPETTADQGMQGNHKLHVISPDGKTTEKSIELGFLRVRSLAASADGQHVWFGGSSDLSRIDPVNYPSQLYPFGLYRSADAGTTWTRETGIDSPVLDIQTSASFLYARTENALWRRPLGGTNWNLVVRRPMAAFATAGDQVIYIANGKTLLRSNDAGATWSAPIQTPATQDIYATAAMTASPDRVLITQGFRSWSSEDGGKTWAELVQGVFRLFSDPLASAIYICRAPSSPSVWTPQGTTVLNIPDCGDLTGDPGNTNTIYFSMATGKFGRSLDAGKTITMLAGPDISGRIAVSGTLVARGWKELQVSTDGAATWKAAAMPTKGEIFNLIARGSTLFAVMGSTSQTKDGILGRANISAGTVDVLTPLAGGQAETVNAVSVDAAGSVYAAGTAAPPAENVPSFPVTQGAIRSVEAAGDGFAVKLSATTCTVGVSPASWTVPPGGGTLTVNITASNCAWSFAQLPSWMTTSGPNSGTGNASTQLTVAANPTLTPRTGSFAVGDTAFSVNQASVCTMAVTPPTVNVGPLQGSSQFTVTMSQPYCSWSALTTSTWLSLSGTSGTGTVVILFTYQANNSVLERSASIDVLGQTVTVVQSGGTCSISLRQTSGTVGAAGGLHQVPLNPVIRGCDVTASTTTPWLKVTALGSFVGLDASTNTGPARAGTVTVGTQTYTLNQADGSGCSFSIDKTTVNVSADGDAAGIRINLTATPNTCAWATFSRASWAQIYPLQGTGSRSVFLTVLPNFSSKVRSTTVDIAGQTLAVEQAANTEAEIRRLVRLLYYGFFGRSASSGEVDFHIASMTQISQAQMAENFLRSLEFSLGGGYIAGLYVGLLDRNAEYGGWEFNRNALTRGKAHYTVLTYAFLTSAEYKLRFGTPDNTQFARLLYRHILGREGSDAEIAYQVAGLATIPREWVAHSFLYSEEFRSRTEGRLLAMLLPATLLMRDTTDAERVARIRSYEEGATVRSMIEQLINSAEFAALYK